MTNNQFFLSALALISACTCSAQPKPAGSEHANQPAFACNLKAFQPEERKRWRELVEQVTSAVVVVRELSNGYALQVNPTRAPVVEVVEWIALERKCCPFFDFQVDLRGEDGGLWLSLKGREGVKQFIEMNSARCGRSWVSVRV